MKRWICLFCFCLYSPINFAKDVRILSVDEPPANYLNENNKPEGYAVDIINALKKQVGSNSEIEFTPEARAINLVRTQANILLFSISRTDFRESDYRWIGPIFTKKWEVYALKKSNLIINNFDDLKTLPIIGLVRGDVREEWLINKKLTNLHSVTHHQQNIQRLLIGRVSAIVYEKSGMSQLFKALQLDETEVESIFTIKEAPVYIAISKKTSLKTFNIWQRAFNKIKQNGQLKQISTDWQKKLKDDFKIKSKISNQLLTF